jgi:hypothetical protein
MAKILQGLNSLSITSILLDLEYLAPAIEVIYPAIGFYQYSNALLGIIGAAMALVDCRLNENNIVDELDTDNAPFSIR